MLYDVLICETKFTVGKSKEMVITAGKEEMSLGELDTFGEFHQEMSRYNTAPV